MSYVLAGAALSKMVLAHDCRNANPDTLYETYAVRSKPQISQGQRWFYCAGLAIALACAGTSRPALSEAFHSPLAM